MRAPPTIAFIPLAAGIGLGALWNALGTSQPDAPTPVTAASAAPVVKDAPPPQPLGTDLEVAAMQLEAQAPQPQLGPIRYDDAARRYTAPLGTGEAVLTLDPALQARLTKTLQDGRTPYAATVLIEAGTGKVLAIAEHSTHGDAAGLAFRPIAKAASVFKIVTTSALLRAGVPKDERVCFHGGKHRMTASNLKDDPRKDGRCVGFGEILPMSANVAIAKLADRKLTHETLAAEAERFLFNKKIPFALPVETSIAAIPASGFDFADTAAGFGDVKLSAFHGALLASIVANGGLFVPPEMVETTTGTAAPEPGKPVRAISKQIAASLKEMMAATVTMGTGRKTFSDPRTPSLGKVKAAGKTGSLTDYSTKLDTSWFVGFAPVDDPQVIVATVIVNELIWHVKAPYVAKEALRAYFDEVASPGDRTAAR